MTGNKVFGVIENLETCAEFTDMAIQFRRAFHIAYNRSEHHPFGTIPLGKIVENRHIAVGDGTLEIKKSNHHSLGVG